MGTGTYYGGFTREAQQHVRYWGQLVRHEGVQDQRGKISWKKELTNAIMVFLPLLGIFAVILICVWAIIARTARPHDPISTDRAKLSQLASAIYGYTLDHGNPPSPAEYKAKLMDGGYVEDETAFYSYSKAGRTEIRYFVSGNRFVLVVPGANDRYDTPEGYEELENAETTGDDLLRFGSIGRKAH